MMMTNVKNLPYLKASEDVDDICKPLKENFGLTSFVYHKNFNHCAEIRLTNQPQWVEHFYQNELYKISGFEKHPKEFQSGYVVWSHLTHHQPILKEARKFNIDHGMTFIQKTTDGCEYYFLGTAPDKPELVNFYLNHIDLLERFILYFKEKAAPIITKASQSPLIIPNKFKAVVSEESGIPYADKSFNEKFIRQTKIKKLHVDNHIVLSSRELDCARLLIQGKTTRQIAETLFISPRTVDTHLNHLKEKLACQTKSELIAKLLEIPHFLRILS